MVNRDKFYIRRVQNVGTGNKCPACEDSFTTSYLAVHQDNGPFNNEPICELCAWEKASSLAALLYLADVAGAYGHAEPPPHIVDGLEQRRADPERLKRRLKEDHKSLHDNGCSPLAELVAGQVKAALDSGTVETMRKAKALVEETRNYVPRSVI